MFNNSTWMSTYKLCHHRCGGGVLSCCNDTSWCHSLAIDGEEPRHVIRKSRCACSINWCTLRQQPQSLIPGSDVSPIDLNLRVTWRGDSLYHPILAKYALGKMCFDYVKENQWYRGSPRTRHYAWVLRQRIICLNGVWVPTKLQIKKQLINYATWY